MQYINPIEILGLSSAIDVSSIDVDIIKKEKRKLFADIDLSDNGHFEYHGLQLTKGDCEKAIDELANKDLKEFYLYLATNKKLNTFLVNGNDAVFTNFQQDSIFKLPDFIKFISPYFASKFDKALLNAYENEDEEQTKAILNTSFLIAQSDINVAYKSVSINIENNIIETKEMKEDIIDENGDWNEDNIPVVMDIIRASFPTEMINCLPNYFQSQILKIAKEINYLNIAIWDNLDDTQVCNDLLEHILTLNISGLDKPTFEKNYKIVSKKNEARIEQEKNAPVLKRYAKCLLAIIEIKKQLEIKNIAPKMAFENAMELIDINEINQLGSIGNEIRRQFALLFRSISICSWNEHDDIDNSIKFIEIANNITTDEDTNSKIESDLADLISIRQDRKKQGAPVQKVPELGIFYGIGLQIYNDTRYFTIFHIPIFAIDRFNLEKGWNSYTFFGKLPLHKWQKGLNVTVITLILFAVGFYIYDSNNSSYSNDDYYSTTTQDYSSPTSTNDYSTTDPIAEVAEEPIEEFVPPAESEYKGNQLDDGDSPLSDCFGSGIYSGNATLTIKNGGNSDAIICLYSVSKDRTIRNEYVQKNSSFKMSNIAQGEYKIRVFYGNDWNPELENSCGTNGNFESDINFSEFDGTEYFEDSERGYTNATITLYTVANGNASSSSIDQSKFFNN